MKLNDELSMSLFIQKLTKNKNNINIILFVFWKNCYSLNYLFSEINDKNQWRKHLHQAPLSWQKLVLALERNSGPSTRLGLGRLLIPKRFRPVVIGFIKGLEQEKVEMTICLNHDRAKSSGPEWDRVPTLKFSDFKYMNCS